MLIANRNKELLNPGWVVGRHSCAKVRPAIAGLTASFFVKGTFRLHPGASPTLWEEGPDFGSGDTPFAGDASLGPGYASDFVPYKPHADFAAVGSACPPPDWRGTSFWSSMSVGSQTRSVAVFGDRQWKEALLGSVPGPAAPAKKTLLSYVNAWGGPDYGRNPLGKGREGPEMPALEMPGYPVESRLADMEPAGFAPLAADWSQRRSKLGSYRGDWVKTGWPWLPADFDYTYFNAAPPGQWVKGYLQGDEELVFKNMHPAHPVYRTHLPKLRARCFLTQTLNWKVGLPEKDAQRTFFEVPLDLDSLWVDMDLEKLILVWRGRAAVRSLKLHDIEHMLILAEPLDAPQTTLAGYHAIMMELLEPASEAPSAVPPPPSATAIQIELEEKHKAVLQQVLKSRQTMAQAAKAAAKEKNAMIAQGDAQLARTGLYDKLPPPAALLDIAALQTRPDGNAMLDHTVNLARSGPGMSPEAIGAIRANADVFTDPDPLESLQTAVKTKVDDSAAKSKKTIEELRKEFLPKPERKVPMRDGKVDLKAVRMQGLENVDATGVDFSDLDLSGVNFCGALLREAGFVRSRLTGADFTDANLSNADLTQADLTSAILDGVDLHDCIVEDTIWAESSLSGAQLSGLNLAGADFSGAYGDHADFTGANLTGARFPKASFPSAQFTATVAERADFSGAVLVYADFRGAKAANIKMPEADVRHLRAGEGADFSKADFKRAQGANSIWENSTLDEADFQQASLPQSRFCEASLISTGFDRCDLTGTVFEDAILRNAELTNANLLRSNFDRADMTNAAMDGSNLYGSGFWDTILLRATWKNANVKNTKLDI